jgi:undecaprenyl-diphosphatase
VPEIIKVIVLGFVEGLTEFLPISSTGHLIVASALLDFNNRLRTTFDIFIQVGAVVAVIAFYRADLIKQASRVTRDTEVQRFWLNIIIAFVPAAAIGFLLSDEIDRLLFTPGIVGLSLIVGGVVFLLVERQGIAERASTKSIFRVSLRQALLIGIAQTLALIPGVSRSGASIIGAMLAGLDRSTATEFSFYLAIPTLGVAALYSLFKQISQIQSGDWLSLIIGAVVSGIVAWIAIRWLLNYVSRNDFQLFGYYRILAGLVILLLIAGHLLSG